MENNNNYELQILNENNGLGLYIINKKTLNITLLFSLNYDSWYVESENISLKELAENYLTNQSQKNKIEEITEQHEEKCMVNQNPLSEFEKTILKRISEHGITIN